CKAMFKKLLLTTLFISVAAAGCSHTEEESDAPPPASQEELNVRGLARLFFLTAKTVVESTLEDVAPKVRPTTSTEIHALEQGSAFAGNFGGPLSSWGPLGTLGPIGDHSWNPSQLAASYEGAEWRSLFSQTNGPLGEGGPLSASGILADKTYPKVLSEYRAG